MDQNDYSMTLDAVKDLSTLALRLYIAILLYSDPDGYVQKYNLDGEIYGIVGRPTKKDFRDAYRDLLELHMITFDGTYTRPVTTNTLYNFDSNL
jgi:hypothetical protein